MSHRLRTVLAGVLILTFGFSALSMFASAMKGAYPGLNGKIAFIAEDQDPLSRDWEIFVMNSDGSGVQQLTHNGEDDDYPCWSPTSEQIAFVRSFNSIWVMNANGAGERQVVDSVPLVNYYSPAWSPDGTKLAYSWYQSMPYQRDVYVIDASTTGLGTKLIEGAVGPSWSPDGTMIAYFNETDFKVWVADSTTGTPIHNVTSSFGFSPCWSPDGTQIVFINREYRVFVINADGTNEQPLTTPPPPLEDYSPNWSPDGTKIIFGRYEDSILIMDADGSNVVDLTPDLPEAMHPDWSIFFEPEQPVGGVIGQVSVFQSLAPFVIVIAILSTFMLVVITHRRSSRQIPSRRDHSLAASN